MVKSDSGIWINGLDYGGISYVTPHIPELNDTIRTKCEEDLPLCGMPWILPVDYMFRWVAKFVTPLVLNKIDQVKTSENLISESH